MTWALIPIITSVFYGLGSYIENYLIDNAIQKKKAAAFALMRLPGLILSLLILLAFFGRSAMIMPLVNALGLVLAGAINIIGQLLHYRAFQIGDAIDITIFSQASPLISLGLGVMFLGETVSANQALGFLFIIIGAGIVVMATDGSKKSPDFRTAGTTLIYTFFSVASDIVFVYFLPKTGTMDLVFFAQTFFFFQLGSFVFTVLLAVIFPSWRRALTKGFFKTKKSVVNLALAAVDNFCFYTADALFKFGLMIVPVVALLSVVSKGSSLFVSLFMTFVLSKIFPKFIRAKKMSKKMIFRYALSGILIVAGILSMN